MKAEDTVMDGKQMYEIGEASNWFQGCSGVPEYQIDLLEAQAEITFNLRTEDILKQLEEFNHRGLTITEAIELLQ